MPVNDKYLVRLVRQSCRAYAALPAFKDPTGLTINYAELQARLDKNQFFSKKEKGIVACYGEKSVAVPSLFFSVLEAGMAYLPIDRSSPPERVLFILKDSGTRLLIAEKVNEPVLSELFRAEAMPFEICDYAEGLVAFEFSNFKLHHQDLAYVLYTSGSTGQPKGVMHTHDSAGAFIRWCLAAFNLKAGSRFISIAPFSFDLSVFDLFVSLASGGCLFLPKQSDVSNSRLMAKYIEEEKINVLYSTPTFFNALVNYGKIGRKLINSVSLVLMAGEQLMGSTVRAMAEHFPEASYYNLYGPTETNVCLYHRVNPYYCDPSVPVPIGEPCAYAKVRLVEKDGLHELWIGGSSLMCGYIGRTADLKPFAGEWYYNTGDLVERNNSGQYVFRGRSDRMVKRSGYRIEPAEIEAAVQQYPAVSEVSAVGFRKEADMKIAVFFVADEKITDIQLRNFCLTRLPAYMIPDVFVQVSEIKKNANLKTDHITLLTEHNLAHLI